MIEGLAIDVSAAVQVFILYLVVYAILKSVRGSRVGQVLTGVGVLAAFAALFTFVFRFDVLSELLRLVLVYLAMSTVVIFQPEIRRILSTVGAFGSLERRRGVHDAASPEEIVRAMIALADRRIGALVAFERGISLRSYEESGVRLDAIFSLELARTVFTPPMPLHDGAMTIRDGRISAAHCVLPVSNNPDLSVSGMRHRAAVGLSEETDAIVLVVSEERGTVSIAHNGQIFRYAGDTREPSLLRWVEKAMAVKRARHRLLRPVIDRLFARAPKPAKGAAS